MCKKTAPLTEAIVKRLTGEPTYVGNYEITLKDGNIIYIDYGDAIDTGVWDENDYCEWKYEGEYYETSCDNTIDADLDEDWHKFCHRCGKFIWYVHSEEE